MNLGGTLAGLDPFEQTAVALIYFEGRTYADAARILAVDNATVAAGVARAFQAVSRWVFLEDGDASSGDEPAVSPSSVVGLTYVRGTREETATPTGPATQPVTVRAAS